MRKKNKNKILLFIINQMNNKTDYYYKNREKILDQRAKYYEENKTAINERANKYFKSYYEKNKEKLISNSVNYMQELRKLMTAEERRANLDRHKQYKKKSNIKLKKLSYQELMNNNIVLKLPEQKHEKEIKTKPSNNIIVSKQNFILDFD